MAIDPRLDARLSRAKDDLEEVTRHRNAATPVTRMEIAGILSQLLDLLREIAERGLGEEEVIRIARSEIDAELASRKAITSPSGP
jgi:hypothetical protein